MNLPRFVLPLFCCLLLAAPLRAQVPLGDLQIGVDLLLAGDAESAADILLPLAEQGDGDARYLLATDAQLSKSLAMEGWRRAHASREAADEQLQAWLGTTADAGHPGALEAMVSRGQNLATRMHYAERGAAAGLAVAQEWLGAARFGAYAESQARPEDAVAWLELAAEAGRSSAAIALGVRYLYGNGLPVDEERGVRWLIRATDLGDPTALLPLARAGATEPSVVGGREEALRWLMTAQENLGEGLARSARELGESLERDAIRRAEDDARIWWERKRADLSTPLGRTDRWLQEAFEESRDWANWEVAFLASNVDCPAPTLQRLVINNYEASGHFDACMLDALRAYGVR
ncbi:tetratricopeptide repeat protein [Algihabitans albus]|uniref:tetratricopeptide repeat protein n=1 Tax=Algihabitans albus TaxID=2164067 RepID=UPI000E5C8CA0|nr:tetratricopeptide repeat protein [Algihabitans albus]